MNKKLWVFTFVVVLLVVAAVPAFADGPNFGPVFYADDETWGTKGLHELPPPNDHNDQSFDGLFNIEGQDMAVAEAAPGNPLYNGGRWAVYNVTWNTTPELVTSYEQLMELETDGAVTIVPAGVYLECPLLPDKS